MNPERSAWIVRSIGLLIVIGLPILGTWLRRQSDEVCALDGIPLDPLFEVQMVDAHDVQRRFCCLQCARWWIERASETPKQVLVTDETSGRLFDAGSANYVRSGVITNASTGNRVHVFKNKSDAEKHAQVSRGTILSGSEQPFATSVRPSPSN